MSNNSRKVRITFDATNPELVGQVVNLDVDEARDKVEQGRAVYVTDSPRTPAPAKTQS